MSEQDKRKDEAKGESTDATEKQKAVTRSAAESGNLVFSPPSAEFKTEA